MIFYLKTLMTHFETEYLFERLERLICGEKAMRAKIWHICVKRLALVHRSLPKCTSLRMTKSNTKNEDPYSCNPTTCTISLNSKARTLWAPACKHFPFMNASLWFGLVRFSKWGCNDAVFELVLWQNDKLLTHIEKLPCIIYEDEEMSPSALFTNSWTNLLFELVNIHRWSKINH